MSEPVITEKKDCCPECGFPVDMPREPVFLKNDIFSYIHYEENVCENCGHQKDGTSIEVVQKHWQDMARPFIMRLKEKDAELELMLKEGCIKVGEVTLWKCSECNQWHEGEIYKCPLKQDKNDIQIMKSTLVELRQRLLRVEQAAEKKGWVL